MNKVARFAAAATWILFCSAAPAAAHCVDYEQYTHPIGMVEAGDLQGAFAVSGAYAYVTVLRTYPDFLVSMVVLDISDPVRPRQVGSLVLPTQYWYFGIAAVGSLVVLTSQEYRCLLTIDASNPQAPQVIGELGVEGVESVAAFGSYAYLTGRDFNVVDISHPVRPRLVASISGSCAGIALAPPYAYVGGMNQGFLVIDISDPVHPAVVASLPTSADDGLVSVSGDRAYVDEYDPGLPEYTLRVVDISDPLHPRFRGSLSEYGEIGGLAAGGSTLYAADPTWGLHVIDASDPDHPTEADGILMPYWMPYTVAVAPSLSGPGADVYATGSATFDAMGYAGEFYAFAVQTRPQVPFEGHVDLPGLFYRLAASGPRAYLACGSHGLVVVDASDPAHPAIVGTAGTPDDALGVAVVGKYAYVADATCGLEVVDVADPASPIVLGHVDTPGSSQDVAVQGRYAYVADGAAGLEVIEVSDAAHPSLVGGTNATGDIQEVAISGDYAYVTGWSSGLHVAMISDPRNPRVVGDADLGGYAHDVQVSGRTCYVAAGRGLCLVDVQDPTQPQLMGRVWGPYFAQPSSVALTSLNVYLATCDAAVQVIDARDPRRPRTKGWINTDVGAFCVAASGSHLFMAEQDGCAHTYRLLVAPVECEPTVRPPIDGPIRLTPGPLATARPNPMRGATTVQLSVPASTWVRAEIWDVTGRLVRTLHDGLLPAGPRDLSWNGRDQEGRPVPAGIYWIRVEGAGATTTRRLVVLR